MAHVLKIIQGATTLVDITANLLVDYEPAVGDWSTVTETAEILKTGLSVAGMEALQQSFDTAFRLARESLDNKQIEPVYLERQLSGSANVDRSRLRDGQAGGTGQTLAVQWFNGVARARISWTREDDWNGARVELPLTNGNGSGIGGRGIWAHDDSDTVPSHDNWVQIAAVDVGGSMPAPVELEITHTYATSQAGGIDVYLNHRANPANLVHILEGEASTASGSNTADATSSGGSYRTATWAGDTAQKIFEWPLSSAQLGYFNSNRVELATRFATTPSGTIWAHWRVLYNSITPLKQTDEVLLDTVFNLQQFGDVRLPPRNMGSGTIAALSLALYARKVGGGSLAIDYVHLGVVNGRRSYPRLSYGLGTNMTLVDDAINGYIGVETGTGRAPFYGEPTGTLLLEPGKLQRLYFLASTTSGSAPIARTFTIRAYYRPRRRRF